MRRPPRQAALFDPACTHVAASLAMSLVTLTPAPPARAFKTMIPPPPPPLSTGISLAHNICRCKPADVWHGCKRPPLHVCRLPISRVFDIPPRAQTTRLPCGSSIPSLTRAFPSHVPPQASLHNRRIPLSHAQNVFGKKF